MTSKEIIEREIAKLATSIQLALGCVPAMNINIELCQQKLSDLKQLKQDLDKLEKLEKKYQELEERFKKRAELCSEFSEYTRQYEKVLDFLMDKFKLELKGNRLYFLYNNQYFELDKEEEKLIKEALGYE